MAVYISVDGITKGDVTAKGYDDKKWFECSAAGFGLERELDSRTGYKVNRETKKVEVNEFTFTKKTDTCSPALFRLAAIGTAKDVKCHVVKTGEKKFEAYVEYVFYDAIFTKYEISMSEDSSPEENCEFNFTKVEFKFKTADKKGVLQAGDTASLDLATGEAG